MDAVERELRAMREELARIRGLVEPGMPYVLSFARAAKELSVSLTKLKQMVRDSILFTVPIGRRRMIPASEIKRLANPPVRSVGRPVKAPTKSRAKSRSKFPLTPRPKISRHPRMFSLVRNRAEPPSSLT